MIKARQSLPHIHSMTFDQFDRLIKHGKIYIDEVTEKTDGQAFVIGCDQFGFYSMSSGSSDQKMRNPEDYEKRARAQWWLGRNYNGKAVAAFGHIHQTISSNSPFINHLTEEFCRREQDVVIRGEVFYLPWATIEPSRTNQAKFVGTWYNTNHIGEVGKFIIHSKLPENANHNIDFIVNNLLSLDINFDHDKIDIGSNHIDIREIKSEFDRLDSELILRRTTKSNKEAKEIELSKFDSLRQKTSNLVDKLIQSLNIQPKWGPESEGLVVHPSARNPLAPRFKITSSSFREFKLNQKDQFEYFKPPANRHS